MKNNMKEEYFMQEFYRDLEELLLDPRFSKIEKIKTIGAIYMAASGIQTDSNDENSVGKKVFY